MKVFIIYLLFEKYFSLFFESLYWGQMVGQVEGFLVAFDWVDRIHAFFQVIFFRPTAWVDLELVDKIPAFFQVIFFRPTAWVDLEWVDKAPAFFQVIFFRLTVALRTTFVNPIIA